MNNNEKTIIEKIIKKIERENKNQLIELINTPDLELNVLKALAASLLPPYFKCKSFVDVAGYQALGINIGLCIHRKHNKALYSEDELDDALELLSVVESAFKEERKATKDLYNKQVKTNFTTAQFDKLQHLRKSLNYSSLAAFVRDAAIQALDVKPRQDVEFQHHFEETAKLSRALRHIAENLDGKQCIEDLPSEINALKKDVDITRRMVVESHSSSTAMLLAERFLSVRQLEIILKKKLKQEQEKNQ
jgi:hypothetical protein